jgi:hypothetical protein
MLSRNNTADVAGWSTGNAAKATTPFYINVIEETRH